MLLQVEQILEEMTTHVGGIVILSITLFRSLYLGKIAIVTAFANAPPICQRRLKSEFKSEEEG
jgi:hypothetical protein